MKLLLFTPDKQFCLIEDTSVGIVCLWLKLISNCVSILESADWLQSRVKDQAQFSVRTLMAAKWKLQGYHACFRFPTPSSCGSVTWEDRSFQLLVYNFPWNFLSWRGRLSSTEGQEGKERRKWLTLCLRVNRSEVTMSVTISCPPSQLQKLLLTAFLPSSPHPKFKWQRLNEMYLILRYTA